MQLQDLNPGELLRYITTCRKLIAGYRGEVEPLVLCPLCAIASEIRGRCNKIGASCPYCLWEILDNERCADFTTEGRFTFFYISDVRMRPESYPKDALRCIERLERWIVVLENELATRG